MHDNAIPLTKAVIPTRPGIATGGWSQSGELRIGGQSAEGGLPPNVKMQVNFYDPADPRGRVAQQYSITFGLDTEALANPAFRKVNPFATVTFKSEGNSFVRRLSVVNGMTISGVCDHVDVVVIDATVNIGGVGPPPAIAGQYLVSILATPGTRPSGTIEPYIRGPNPFSLAPAGTGEVLIPNASGVKSVTVFAFESGGGIARAQQRDAAGFVLATWSPSPNAQAVPLFPQTEDIRITNIGAAGTVDASMVFGVDG